MSHGRLSCHTTYGFNADDLVVVVVAVEALVAAVAVVAVVTFAFDVDVVFVAAVAIAVVAVELHSSCLLLSSLLLPLLHSVPQMLHFVVVVAVVVECTWCSTADDSAFSTVKSSKSSSTNSSNNNNNSTSEGSEPYKGSRPALRGPKRRRTWPCVQYPSPNTIRIRVAVWSFFGPKALLLMTGATFVRREMWTHSMQIPASFLKSSAIPVVKLRLGGSKYCTCRSKALFDVPSWS